MPTGQMNRVLLHLRRVVEPRNDSATDGQLLERFLRTKDKAAFELLVRRHGPMVLGVCRRIAGNLHDAEDAFQATFLVLARKAAAVSPRELLAGWLYGVAWRTARKARASATRRRAREQPMKNTLHPAAPSADPPDDELQAVLDAELASLPDPQRSAVLLCDVQGRTQRDAARQLGIPVGTLTNRLAAARRTLASRLGRRGIALSAGGIVTALGQREALANVPPALLASTVQAATLTAAGATTAGAVSPAVEALTEGVMKMMLLGKIKTLTAMVLALVVLVVGFGAATLPTLRGNPDEKPVAPSPSEAQKRRAVELGLRWLAVQQRDNISDEEFFRRASLDFRGTMPTVLEMHFYLADRSPKKRERLIELLTGESKGALNEYNSLWLDKLAVQGICHGVRGKTFPMQQCTSCHQADVHHSAHALITKPPGPGVSLLQWKKLEPAAKPGAEPRAKDRFDRLLDELIAAKRPDAQVLEALTLAALGRLPTAAEEKFMLDHVSRQRDRREAFESVLFVLTQSKEAGEQIDVLKARRAAKAAAEVEWKGQWYAADLLKTDGGRYFIRYSGYDDDWNEWVEKDRIRFPKK